MIRLAIIVMFLLLSLVTAGCGIPRQAYQAVGSERDAALAELESTRTELNTLKSELQTGQSGPATIAHAAASLGRKLDLARQVLAFESTRYRMYDGSQQR